MKSTEQSASVFTPRQRTKRQCVCVCVVVVLPLLLAVFGRLLWSVAKYAFVARCVHAWNRCCLQKWRSSSDTSE